MHQHQFPVKLGSVSVTLSSRGLLKQIEWDWEQRVGEQPAPASPAIAWLVASFQAYFSSGTPLGELPWHLVDDGEWTPFQRQVYEVIARIPHGETRTYGWVASRLGNAGAGRAVGQALRANPLPVLIPCHRVVSTGSLGGFMGTVDPDCSELLLKQRLIALEEEYINPVFDFLGPPQRELPLPASEPLLIVGSSTPPGDGAFPLEAFA